MPASTAMTNEYDRVLRAVRSDPDLADALVSDFAGTMRSRFGLDVPPDARLEREGAGYKLTLGGNQLQLPDPRQSKTGELDDAELELVAGGEFNYSAPKSESHSKGL